MRAKVRARGRGRGVSDLMSRVGSEPLQSVSVPSDLFQVNLAPEATGLGQVIRTVSCTQLTGFGCRAELAHLSTRPHWPKLAASPRSPYPP